MESFISEKQRRKGQRGEKETKPVCLVRKSSAVMDCGKVLSLPETVEETDLK